MEILAITASPRRNGNSETLLNKTLSGIKRKGAEIKKIALADLKIFSCNECQACFKTGECVIDDDMQGLYRDLLTADILLIASPIYFQGLPCQLKCVIDRCQALWARKYILDKGIKGMKGLQRAERAKKANRVKKAREAAAILTCASKGAKHTFTGSVITLKAWFNTMDARYKKELLVEGLEEETAALKDRKLLVKAFKFGESLN